jgi:ribosomal protein L37AE/L43A
MPLSELMARYGTEAQCEAALERARWPDGFACPACGAREHSRFLADGRRYWQCAKCRAQCTVCSGTLFHATKLPLTKWFQASAHLVSDGCASFNAAGAEVAAHGAIIVGNRKSSDIEPRRG